MRDIYQVINPNADPKMVALQKVFIVLMGFCAFLMIFVPTVLKSQISILQYAYFAYTMYGVAVTPALFAALTWRRATWQGGLASIIGGAVTTVFFEFILPWIAPGGMQERGWRLLRQIRGGIYPAALVSIGLLIVVSLPRISRTLGRSSANAGPSAG